MLNNQFAFHTFAKPRSFFYDAKSKLWFYSSIFSNGRVPFLVEGGLHTALSLKSLRLSHTLGVVQFIPIKEVIHPAVVSHKQHLTPLLQPGLSDSKRKI